jgi:LytS/YehU family sensor histidine kinase
VKLAVTFHANRVGISVENSGPFIATPGGAGTGHGLALGNVRRRLVICYGAGSDLLIDSDTERTHIHFDVPVPALASV